MSTGTENHTAVAVRQAFLDFFEAQEHRVVPSGPVFPQDDPTLLFTNAGMNQFKDVFLGTGTRDYSRAADTQKCIRVSGKHNDLEEVGRDTYHHTFFEMLGNWSFGDYFKREAIRWAWQLLTETWGLPKERLWVTVFAGDEKDGLPADEEAERLWAEETDIDPARVLRFDRTDNFWEMGETGPCGPCSEIHIDRGGPDSDPADGADRELGVNAGNERFIELWNLVFMQFNRQDDGSLVPLPAPCVDTGMGFERILSVLQGKSSNYDTDLFTPVFRRIEELTGKSYPNSDEEVNVAFRVCADHVRAVSSAFGDGALPSNEGRGYVLRRLIRRASRFGKQNLGQERPFLYEVVPTVAEILGTAFPEIGARLEHIQLLVKSEEESFGKTLDRGLVLFGELADKVTASGSRTLPGDQAFELYATYGFPQDLVELMARERELEVDLDGWSTAQQAHSEASRSEGKFKQLLSAEQLSALSPTSSTCHDAGEAARSLEARVLGFWPAEGGGEARLVLDRSPFYAESGGQVGDSGTISGSAFQMAVRDTQKVGEVVVHLGACEGETRPGDELTATIDAERRAATMANHTGTHLLHRALRDVLGDHVTQQGSYVGPDRLRFDLSHPRGIEQGQLDEIERRVNAAIYAGHQVESSVESLDAAMERGVMALFGEKYGETVRVVDVGGWSMELCGGTHVSSAGEIGPFVILSERAIQAGVRRIEAVTQSAAIGHLQEQRRLLAESAQALKTKPEDVPERLAALQQQVKDAKKKQKASAGADVGAALAQIDARMGEVGGVKCAALDVPDLDGASLRELGDRLKGRGGDLALGLFGRGEGKVPFLVLCLGAAQERGLAAGKLAKTLAGVLGGGGGGRPDVAQGQGMKADAVGAAMEALEGAFRAALEG